MLKVQLCHHRNKVYFKIYKNRKQLFQIEIIFSKYNTFFYCILDQINLTLVKIWDLKNIKQNNRPQMLELYSIMIIWNGYSLYLTKMQMFNIFISVYHIVYFS